MKYSFCPSVRRLKTDYVEDVPVWKQWWLHVNWKWDIPAVINLWAVKFLIVLIYWKWMEDSFCPENDIVIFLAVAFFFSWSSLRINSKIILCKLTYVWFRQVWAEFSNKSVAVIFSLSTLRQFFLLFFFSFLTSPTSARKASSYRLASQCAKLASKIHNGLEVTAELSQELAVFTQRYGGSVESTNCTECFSQCSYGHWSL